MKYLELQSMESFYKRVELGMPVCKIFGRIESSTELIDEWNRKKVQEQVKKGIKTV